MNPVIMWFRRDLRTHDHPALTAAVEAARLAGTQVLPLFVFDDALLAKSGQRRIDYLNSSLQQLDIDLWIRRGNPAEVVPQLAKEVGTSQVFVTKDYGPYGRRRDAAVKATLEAVGIGLEEVGSAYSIDPTTITSGSGKPYEVFAAFYQRWLQVPKAGPMPVPDLRDLMKPAATDELAETKYPHAGEKAASARLDAFISDRISDYATNRDIPGIPGTSHLSVSFKWGELHPRTALSRIAKHVARGDEGAQSFQRELAFREFYAAVIAAYPEAVKQSLNPRWDKLELDEDAEAQHRLEAWQQGRTGYPLVDAGMRQLNELGWMHNRVRMLVASFLVKDLHLDWRLGAQWFMQQLLDADIASNSQGWQWAAGAGLDAAPFFRVFNPILQSKKFDPAGDYLKRWIPELQHLDSKQIHEPWKAPVGLAHGYPAPIVDHAVERKIALDRWNATR